MQPKGVAGMPTNSGQNEQAAYWLSPVPDLDDFGNPIHDEFIDGATSVSVGGAWAIMTPFAWTVVGRGSLGLGKGQRYKKQEDGKWLKVEG